VRGYAKDMGVTLALQNHKPLIKDHRDVLRMVREVNSPHLKICLDAPLMPDKSAATMREAAQAVGSLQVMSHFGGEFARNPDGSITGVDRIDGVVTGETNQYYRDFARAMRRSTIKATPATSFAINCRGRRRNRRNRIRTQKRATCRGVHARNRQGGIR